MKYLQLYGRLQMMSEWMGLVVGADVCSHASVGLLQGSHGYSSRYHLPVKWMIPLSLSVWNFLGDFNQVNSHIQIIFPFLLYIVLTITITDKILIYLDNLLPVIDILNKQLHKTFKEMYV